MQIGLSRIIENPFVAPILSPKGFKRRNDEIEVSGDLIRAHFAHLDSVRDRVKGGDVFFEISFRVVRIPFSANGEKIGEGGFDDARLLRRFVQFLKLFLKIEGWHGDVS